MGEEGDRYRGSVAYQKVYAELIRAAEVRGVITYKLIAQMIGRPIGRTLGEISREEARLGRPLLSALAVGVDGKPGNGFFSLAEEMGRLPAGAGHEEQLAFWEAEREAVYRTWARKFKYAR